MSGDGLVPIGPYVEHLWEPWNAVDNGYKFSQALTTTLRSDRYGYTFESPKVGQRFSDSVLEHPAMKVLVTVEHAEQITRGLQARLSKRQQASEERTPPLALQPSPDATQREQQLEAELMASQMDVAEVRDELKDVRAKYTALLENQVARNTFLLKLAHSSDERIDRLRAFDEQLDKGDGQSDQ